MFGATCKGKWTRDFWTFKHLFHRGEYNVAVLQLKTKLVFHDTSRYRPVCLPPKCDHVCRTRKGKTREDLDGNKKTMTNNPGFRTLYFVRIISNEKCHERINSYLQTTGGTALIRTIKRLQKEFFNDPADAKLSLICTVIICALLMTFQRMDHVVTRMLGGH